MQSKPDIALYRKSLAEIEQNIEILQRQYDVLPSYESTLVSSPSVTKRNEIATMIFEQKQNRFKLLSWIKFWESEEGQKE